MVDVVITSLRLPDDIAAALAKYAKEQELSKNQVVKMALRAFLGVRKDGLAIKGITGQDIAAARKIVEAYVDWGKEGGENGDKN